MPSGPAALEAEATARPGIDRLAPVSSGRNVPRRPTAPPNLISLAEHRRHFYEAWQPADE